MSIHDYDVDDYKDDGDDDEWTTSISFCNTSTEQIDNLLFLLNYKSVCVPLD